MSYGQELAIKWLSLYIKRQPDYTNYRPNWLNGLELDAYWEREKIALEFQGDQHYVPLFGQEDLYKQRYNDKCKRKLCEDIGITLVQIDACDLYFAAMNKRIKTVFGKKGRPKIKHNVRMTDEFNRLEMNSKSYRTLLNEKYGAPSAAKRGSKKRKKLKIEFYNK